MWTPVAICRKCFIKRPQYHRLLRKFLGLVVILLVIRILSYVTLELARLDGHDSGDSTEIAHTAKLIAAPDPLVAAYPVFRNGFRRSVYEQEVYDALVLDTTRTCPGTLRPETLLFRNDVWHMYQNGAQEIHVYSAFFDDRPATGVLPSLRLLAVATPTTQALYCHVWYEGIRNPLVVTVNVRSSGRGDKIRGIKYGQYQYTCQLQHVHPMPTHVSVVPGVGGLCSTASTMLVPVQAPVRGAWTHEFGVCVAIAFGTVPWHQLVEWIELTHMQGVAEINIYNGSMDASMRPLFQYYEDRGFVRVHQMPPPQYDYSKMGAKLSSPASLNDCMLRYMYRYKYVVIVDFDEIIVPRLDDNYHDMLARVDRNLHLKEPSQSYTFRNLYHFSDIAPKPGPVYSTMLRYRKHNKHPSPHLFVPKSFIDPRRCESVFNHYCYVRFKNDANTPDLWTIDVSTDVAMSHHYRKCNLKSDKCQKMIAEAVDDDFMLKFNVTLTGRMLRAFKDLNYHP